MNRNKLTITLLACALATLVSAHELRRLNYQPDGRDIKCRDGDRRYTRALYGGNTDFRLETSDRPIFATYRRRSCRNVRFFLTMNGRRTPLHETTHAEARYNSGCRSYVLTDDDWPSGSRLMLTALAQPDAESAIFQFENHGLPPDAVLTCVVCDILHPQLKRNGDMNSDPADAFDPSPDETNRLEVQWTLHGGKTYVTVDCDAQGRYTLSLPEGQAAQHLFDKAWAHHEWLSNSIVFSTPDPFLNPLGGALMSASDGAWDGEVWLHGAVVWRMQLNGWRAGYLGDVLGMPERARSHFSAYAESQTTDVQPTIAEPALDAEKGLSRARKQWGTNMYSSGYIGRYPHRTDVMHHYDMNLNFVDELLWHFEYDADTAFMRRLWPLLQRHLAWEKRNWDPDDDGLYDAYCCIWASDGLYYNSGAVTHSSAYNYRANRLAARIAELLNEDPQPYRREAEKTLAAMNRRLWLSDRGHWAEYQDYMGLKRIHPHAALWSIYIPIDCGLASTEQAFRATQYVDSCIPHIPLHLINIYKDPSLDRLQTISTSDWMPYDWSVNNVAAEEVMHTALAYFQAGRADEAYKLLKANVLDQAYLGGSPGNFGQISYYDKARGELYRDFSDNCGISARTLIQGLFGIIPNALDNRCILRPGFPSEWDSASIRTPYFIYSFRREGNKEIYEVEQRFQRPLQIVLRQNTGDGGFRETLGTSELRQTFVVDRVPRLQPPRPLVRAYQPDREEWGNRFDDVRPTLLEPVTMDHQWNASVSDIFTNEYLTPRSPWTTLQLPVHGLGEWCHPETTASIDDSALRQRVSAAGLLTADSLGIPFRYGARGRNVAYTSLWDNYPDSIVVEIKSKSLKAQPSASEAESKSISSQPSVAEGESRAFSHAYLLMAGSTNHMQSHIDNGLVIAHYTDGSADTLRLHNPHNWCPIEQDYYEDGLAFHSARPRPVRIDFATARVSRQLMPMGPHYGRPAPGGVAGSYNDRRLEKGAGVILDMKLNPAKPLSHITLRTLSNDVVIGLMAVTLQRKTEDLK